MRDNLRPVKSRGVKPALNQGQQKNVLFFVFLIGFVENKVRTSWWWAHTPNITTFSGDREKGRRLKMSVDASSRRHHYVRTECRGVLLSLFIKSRKLKTWPKCVFFFFFCTPLVRTAFQTTHPARIRMTYAPLSSCCERLSVCNLQERLKIKVQIENNSSRRLRAIMQASALRGHVIYLALMMQGVSVSDNGNSPLSLRNAGC